MSGAAIVAEAGPELLLQQGNKTKVIPLSNNSQNTSPNNDEKFVINNTFNNNSKWQSPSKEAIEVRKQLQWYYLTKKGRRA